jgi:hypothetical protein
MRKSLKSAECFHFFANKVQEEGYSSNVRFKGNDIYSYRTPIARWLPDGSLAVATRNYSPTTTGHQSDLRRALPFRVKVIRVYEIDTVDGVFRQAEILSDNLNKQALTARTRADEYRMQARSIIDDANAYAVAHGDPQRIEVVELTPEQELAHKQALKAANKAERQRKAEREAHALKVNADRLEKWLSGDTSVSAYGLRELGVKLRVLGDIVQTTQGASIPLADALTLWPLVQRCKAGDKCFTPGQPLGSYKLTKIRENGSIVVGCHDVPYSELERIAMQLNIA